jgi:hypothetical protein
VLGENEAIAYWASRWQTPPIDDQDDNLSKRLPEKQKPNASVRRVMREQSTLES